MASATFDTLKFDGKFRESEQRLLAKIDQNKTELTAKIEQLRFELVGRIEQLNSKIDMIHTKLSGDMILIRWMLGLLISFAVAVTIRVFFFPKPN